MNYRTMRPQVALLAFAAAPFVFHHLPSIAGGTAGDWIDLLTPFATVGAAGAALIALRAPPAAVAIGLVGALLYADGHGIHLAANSIRHEHPAGGAESRAHFWDERWGHIEWHSGWIVLAAAIALGEGLARRPRGLRPASPSLAAATIVLLGFTLFTSGVEGGTWWLVLAVTVVFAGSAVRAPRPLLATLAGAFVLASLLMGVWAIWHRGMPHFSELGWI